MPTIAIFERVTPPWSGAETTAVCPSCRATLDVGDTTCPECGAAVTVECRACGKTIGSKTAVCPECGGAEYETFLLE